MENPLIFVYQRRFGYFLFFLAIFSLINSFFGSIFLKKYTLFAYLQYSIPHFSVLFIGLISTLRKSTIMQILQVAITFIIAIATIADLAAVQDMTGEIISFLGILMCIQYGWFLRHFYLKVFGILFAILVLKVTVTISRMEYFTQYDSEAIVFVRFVGIYIVFCTIIFFFWLLTKDQIQEYINKGKGIENRFRKNSVFIDIGKLVWGFLHDLGNLNYTIVDIRILKKSLLQIQEELEQKEIDMNNTRITDSINSATRIEEMLLSIDNRQEQIKKMIKAKHVLQKERIELNDMIDNLAKYLKLTNKLRSINLNLNLFPGKIYICASPFEILQAIENIVQNCIEAISDNNGNLLTISTSVESNKARILISDTGGGIKFIEKNGNVDLELFQIGRTTKEEHGTGWGMYSAIININQNGGHLTVSTLKGIGTSFEILLNLDGGKNG